MEEGKQNQKQKTTLKKYSLMLCHLCNEKFELKNIYRCNNLNCQKRICKGCAEANNIKFNDDSKRILQIDCPHCMRKCKCKKEEVFGGYRTPFIENEKPELEHLSQGEQKSEITLNQKRKIKQPEYLSYDICNKCKNEEMSTYLLSCRKCKKTICRNCFKRTYNNEDYRNYNKIAKLKWVCKKCLRKKRDSIPKEEKEAKYPREIKNNVLDIPQEGVFSLKVHENEAQNQIFHKDGIPLQSPLNCFNGENRNAAYPNYNIIFNNESYNSQNIFPMANIYYQSNIFLPGNINQPFFISPDLDNIVGNQQLNQLRGYNFK